MKLGKINQRIIIGIGLSIIIATGILFYFSYHHKNLTSSRSNVTNQKISNKTMDSTIGTLSQLTPDQIGSPQVSSLDPTTAFKQWADDNKVSDKLNAVSQDGALVAGDITVNSLFLGNDCQQLKSDDLQLENLPVSPNNDFNHRLKYAADQIDSFSRSCHPLPLLNNGMSLLQELENNLNGQD